MKTKIYGQLFLRFINANFFLFTGTLIFMRKTFKPHTKQTKIAGTFRKKTIDPGVDLNIKKDEDNMENIDEYWDMAEYVIDDDKSSPNKQTKEVTNEKNESDKNKKSQEIKSEKNTKSNKKVPEETKKRKGNEKEVVKKNAKKQKKKPQKTAKEETSVQKDVSDATLDITNDLPSVSIQQQSSDNEKSDDTLFDINNIRESLSRNAHKKMSNISNTSGFDTNCSLVQSTKSDGKKIVDTKSDGKKTVDTKSDGKKTVDTKSDGKKIVDTKSDGKKKIKDEIYDQISKVNTDDYKGETFVDKNNRILGMTKITSLSSSKSRLEPIITKKPLESGMLFLKQGDSILNELADYPFTFFLLKGKIDLTVDGVNYTLDRYSCMFIDKESRYNIIDRSRDGSSIFITFKAK